MDWGYKAMLTTVTVALVLLVAQNFGRRLAGLVAGLPVITAPALIWVASEHGAAFAARTAVGSIAACGLMAVFALVYERLSRRHGPAATLAGSLGVGGVLALPMTLLQDHPLRAIAIAFLLCGVVVALLPHGQARSGARRIRGELVLTATAAGLISVAVTLGANQLGPFWAGLLAALPVISATVLVHQHLTGEAGDIQRFLRGYVAGLLGKAVFALAFAVIVLAHGAAAAIAVAMAIGLATSMAVTRGLVWVERRAAPATAP